MEAFYFHDSATSRASAEEACYTLLGWGDTPSEVCGAFFVEGHDVIIIENFGEKMFKTSCVYIDV